MVNVLENGFVELVQRDGDDTTVLQAARISPGTESIQGEIKDRKLISYLMKNYHHSPFEMIGFRFHIKLPIFVMRQLVRHRIASLNEMSGRYRELPMEFYIPLEWRRQSTKNKQGSSVEKFHPDEEKDFFHHLFKAYTIAEDSYKYLLAHGVSRELARILLPVATYTEIYWKINFRSLMNFMFLRRDSHAQHEIQAYGNAVYDILRNDPAIQYCMDAFDVLYPLTFLREDD